MSAPLDPPSSGSPRGQSWSRRWARGAGARLPLITIAAAYIISRALVIIHSTSPPPDAVALLDLSFRLAEKPCLEALRSSSLQPGYPLLLYASHAAGRLAGWDSPQATLVISQAATALCGLAMTLVGYAILLRLTSRRVAWAAIMAFVFLPRTAWYTSDILSDALHAALWLAAVLLILEGFSRKRAGWFLLAGSAAGMAYAVRVAALGLPVAVLAAMALLGLKESWRLEWPARRRRLACAAFLSPFLLVLGGFLALYGKLSPEPVLEGLLKVSSSSPAAPEPGLLLMGWSPGGKLTRVAASIWEFLRFGAQEVQYIHLLSLPLGLFPFLARRLRIAPQGVFFASAFLLSSAAIVVLPYKLGYIDGRYYLPLLPLALGFGFHGLEELGEWLVRKRWTKRSGAGNLFVLGFLVASVGFSLPSLLGRSLHQNRWGTLQAGRWLAGELETGDTLHDPYFFPSYLAGLRHAVRREVVPRNPTGAHYVIAEDGDIAASRFQPLRAAIASGTAVEVKAFPRRAGDSRMGVRLYRIGTAGDGNR
jgi:hypothetical protein